MSNFEHRERAFIGGVAAVGIISWAIRHWQTIAAALFVWMFISHMVMPIYNHLFTPMTSDLTNELNAQYKYIKIVKTEMTVAGGQDDYLHDPWYRHKGVENAWLTIQNQSTADLYQFSVHCTGKTVRQPPDHDYAPEIETSEEDKTIYAISVPAGTTQRVQITQLGATNMLKSDPENLVCTVTDGQFTESGLYEASGEMDKYSTASVHSHMLTSISEKPAYYGESSGSYKVLAFDHLYNMSKTNTITSVRLYCQYVTEFDHLHEAYISVKDLNIKPREYGTYRGEYIAKWEHPDRASCHVDRVN